MNSLMPDYIMLVEALPSLLFSELFFMLIGHLFLAFQQNHHSFLAFFVLAHTNYL